MLAAALAAADAGHPAHDLAEEAVDVVRESEVMAVTAVVREDDVAGGIEMVDDTDRVRLLADVRVGRPDELPQREQLEERLLEPPDENHSPVELAQRCAGHDRR